MRTYRQATMALIVGQVEKLKKENQTLRAQLERAQSDNSRLIKIIDDQSKGGE